MRLLDTVMDALNSIVPDALRTPGPRGGAEVRPGRGGSPGGPEAESGFAATLVQFLRGASPPEKPRAEQAVSRLQGTTAHTGLDATGDTADTDLDASLSAGESGSLAAVERNGEAEGPGAGNPGSEGRAFPGSIDGVEGGITRWRLGLSRTLGRDQRVPVVESFPGDGVRMVDMEGPEGVPATLGSPVEDGLPREPSPGFGTASGVAAGLASGLGSGPASQVRTTSPFQGDAGAEGRDATHASRRFSSASHGVNSPRAGGGSRAEGALGFGASVGEAPLELSGAELDGAAPTEGGVPWLDGSNTGIRASSSDDAVEGSRHTEGLESHLEIDEAPSVTGRNPGDGVDPASGLSSAGALAVADRDIGKLDPEFQARLSRVVTRMEREYGHTVDLVEGYRSRERQAALYEQGRTEPGPVVTWTEESLHSQGRAADLQVDGKWDDPQAYARLQRIAREEGLETLGPKDAGHVQLSEEGAGRARGLGRGQGAVEYPARERISRPARVAHVASPTGAAAVARVARPAQPGLVTPQQETTRTQEPRPQTGGRAEATGREIPDASAGTPLGGRDAPARAEVSTPRAAPPVEGNLPTTPLSSQSGGDRPRNQGASRETDEVAEVSSRGEISRDGSLSSQGWTQRAAAPMTEAGGVEAVRRAGSVERVSEVQALEEAMNARTPGRIHLNLDDADGMGTRLRLSLRGSQLSGTVDMADPSAALRMRNRVGELHEALARQGLDARALGLQGTRGLEAGRGVETDLAALMQDPLAGLGRVLESRQGAMDGRGDRQGTPGEESQRQAGRFRDPAQRDRNKEGRK